ncbi:hypothetical protein MPNT_50114 [Candidatus Methylacidithermus pantelleriae]|uniref:Uncharacterized protein n=1 Tax=Candidatus Methylacidithermus pantelleriae TaxID=2744239 RepID=A0A8J2FX25_9BACT|nr:hypothetical protein MPNT_50114 [Candidatus Methylacidithermus pantelleriae]
MQRGCPCAELGKALVIKRWDLRKETSFESVDFLWARSLFSFAYAKAIAMARKSAFFPPESRGSKSSRPTRV